MREALTGQFAAPIALVNVTYSCSHEIITRPPGLEATAVSLCSSPPTTGPKDIAHCLTERNDPILDFRLPRSVCVYSETASNSDCPALRPVSSGYAKYNALRRQRTEGAACEFDWFWKRQFDWNVKRRLPPVPLRERHRPGQRTDVRVWHGLHKERSGRLFRSQWRERTAGCTERRTSEDREAQVQDIKDAEGMPRPRQLNKSLVRQTVSLSAPLFH